MDSRCASTVTLNAIDAEVLRARIKHPSRATFLQMLAALMEEVGELAQAHLDRKSWDEIQAEAIQVACVAVRIIEETRDTAVRGT